MKQQLNQRTACWLFSLAMLLGGATVASAQFTGDSQTNTVTTTTTDNSWNSFNYAMDVLQINSGGKLTSGGANFGGASGASNNTVVVSDPGSSWNTGWALYPSAAGNAGGNQIIVTNGGVMVSGSTYFGYNGTSPNNTIVVTGSGSSWTNSGGPMYLGYGSDGNQVIIRDGGKFVNLALAEIADQVGSDNNSVLVSGSGSVWSNVLALTVGKNGSGNQLTINDGGQVVSAGAGATIGYYGPSDNNTVLISGPGSVWNATSGGAIVGYFGSGNQLVVTNGGRMNTGDMYVGGAAGANNNTVLVQDKGILAVSALFLNTGGSTGNSVTNSGGVFEFKSAQPTIVLNGGAVVLDNGTISMRGITNADVAANSYGATSLGNITYQGNNTFRLDNSLSKDSGQTYTFGTGLGATNYVDLELINGTWRGGDLTIGNGGTLRGVGTINGTTTIQGTLSPGFSIGEMTFSNGLTLAGSYDVEVDPTGTGSADQIYVFGGALTLTGSTLNITTSGTLDDAAYVIATYDSLVGTFGATTGLPTGYSIDYNYNGENKIAAVIPEPSAMAFTGMGILGMMALLRRRQKR